MPTTLIEQNPNFDKKVEGTDKLAIAEMFCDTIQGEGITAGCISTFIRLQGCTLKCKWCDTLEVWPNGNEYSFDEIFKLFESVGLIMRFANDDHHLILTGGSPLKQQDSLFNFIIAFSNKYGFVPYLEVENECMLKPSYEMVAWVDQWNNSPKLSNSGMKKEIRYKPELIREMSEMSNSWFKFVVRDESDWKEIEEDFLIPGLIEKNQVILMPEGDQQEKLKITRPIVAELAIKYGVHFTDRLHVTIWDKKTGV